MKKVLEVFKKQVLNPPPIWLMRQAGRYLPEYREVRQKVPEFLNLCFTPDLATEVTLQPIRRFGFDASIIFSDILVIPYALGQHVRFEEGIGPVLDSPNWPTFFGKISTQRVAEVLAPVYEAVRQTRRALPVETTLYGFAGAPWTVATYMIQSGKSSDHSEALRWVEDPSTPLDALLGVLADVTVSHLINQINAGADIVQIFDTWAGIVPDHHRERVILRPLQRIMEGLRLKAPDTPIVYYAKGAAEIYPHLHEIDEHLGFSLDHLVTHDLMEKLMEIPCVFQGNLSPDVLVEGGEKLEEDISAICDQFRGRPFIFNLGHGILPHTPVENVHKLIDFMRGLAWKR